MHDSIGVVFNSPCHSYLNSYTLSQRVILGVAVKDLLL